MSEERIGRFNPLSYRYKKLGKIEIKIAGKNSLFYALEMSRLYQLIGKNEPDRLTFSSWKRLSKNIRRQRQHYVYTLMNNIDINMRKKTYGIYEIEIIQDYWDEIYDKKFRIVAFDNELGLWPIFKGNGPRLYNVCIIKNKKHWEGMKSISQFFTLNKSKYCIDCETTYDRAEKHRASCRVRCKNCYRMGFGFPCKKVENVKILCSKCSKTFFNNNCYEEHMKKRCTFDPQSYPYKKVGKIEIMNYDKNSLFYALEMSRLYQLIGRNEKDSMAQKGWKQLSKNVRRQREEYVITLIDNINIDLRKKSYGIEELEIIQNYWDIIYEKKFRIVAFRKELGLKPIYKGKGPRLYNVCIILDKIHWEGIKSINQFFTLNSSKFCIDCELTYQKEEKHTLTCEVKCKMCCRMGIGFPCERENNIKILCPTCNRTFFNSSCFKEHLKKICKKYKKCLKCEKEYSVEKKKQHICGQVRCQKCWELHKIDEPCFIRKIKIPKELPEYRIVSYDLECTTNNEIDEGKYKGKKEHKPNFISARVTCTNCEEEIKCCKICGPKSRSRHYTWCSKDGIDPIKCFVQWILRFKKYETYAFAHFGARYDSHFVLHELLEQGYNPEIILADLKIYEVQVKKYKAVFFRDTWLLTQNKLADLPKTFDLQTSAKLFFPHKYNREDNYGKVLNTLPPIDDYNPNSMSDIEYEKLIKWHKENYNTEFILENELAKYCANDTKILLETIIKMRKIFIDITKDEQSSQGYDVLKNSITIASASINIYRAKFLKDKHLTIVPENGFEKCDNESEIAIKYFEWIMETEKVWGKHAGNGGEVVFYGYKVDFLSVILKKIIEFHGCAYHGCKKCFKRNQLQANGESAENNYKKTQEKMSKLNKICKKHGYKLEQVWECDVRKELKMNRKMREYFNEIPDKGPINPRLAFHGGRTGPMSLFANSDDKYEIKMADIVSLYPFVNYSTPYPVDVPEIIRPREYKVNWTKPEDLKCNGLLKVRILPPKDLKLPLLPFHMDDMLLFPLCRKCSETKKSGFILSKNFKKCVHNKKNRSLTGIYTSIELCKALELGYKIDRFYRGYHYENFDNNLFKEYVKKFLKIKVESSGYPDDVINEDDKGKYIKIYKEKYGIELNKENIKYNPGMRHIAKLALNSLWGKFSMRNKLNKTRIINNDEEMYKMVLDHTIIMGKPIYLANGKIRVTYKDKEEYIIEHKTSNVIISLWTTSKARLELYKHLEKIFKAKDCKLLYTDTDSVIYLCPRGKDPLETGQFLGDMSKEHMDCEILEYVSAGPKQYALKLRKKSDGKISYKTKIRGMTLDKSNKMDYEEFKKMILNYREGFKKTFTYNDKFGPTRENLMISRIVKKEYEPIQKKGIIDENLDVLPFGYY